MTSVLNGYSIVANAGFHVLPPGGLGLFDPAIADCGEGTVRRTTMGGMVAKIYHAKCLNPRRIRKLEVMIDNPPVDPMARLGLISIAWPRAIVRDPTGKPVGFLMSFVDSAQTLQEIFTPKSRLLKAPWADWRYLHVTAMNLAILVQALHDMGYVICDVQPKNFLSRTDATVAAIDMDSIQVRRPGSHEIFRCLVRQSDYVPPELLGADYSKVDGNESHDRYGLALLIYWLLFGHNHYYAEWTGSGSVPDDEELLRRGEWIHAPRTHFRPTKYTNRLEIVHPDVQALFHRAFTEGHRNPSRRPTAEEWRRALATASANLLQCSAERSHYYSNHRAGCYWCERKQLIGFDAFPALPSPKPAPKPTPVPSNRTKPHPIPTPAPQTPAIQPPMVQPAPWQAPPVLRHARRQIFRKVAAVVACLAALVLFGAIRSLSFTRSDEISHSGGSTKSAGQLRSTSNATVPGFRQNVNVTSVSENPANPSKPDGSVQTSDSPVQSIRVEFLAYPWAKIQVDGETIVEETPASSFVSPGRHVVTFVHPNRGTLRRSVQFESGQGYVIKGLFQERNVIVTKD